ncbi:MobH family relaxase [Sulfuricystis multivorans]|uniref:MobH family relaxase n=1 Tax=Sulfuricystis multivorans TaxID=2211108 RepID=UPI000F8163CB|nr:MobH family relaxase [Sulfuricystis multivorans]
MLKFIRRLLTRTPTQQSAPLLIPQKLQSRGIGLDVYPGEEDPGDYAITRYPPFDKGIPVIPVEKILQSQQELLDRIFRTAGVSRADFNRLYMPAVRNMAEHVHLLPATSTTYFRGTGGLFRMSLEIALNSLQSANAAVFPTGGGVERRFFMQPKWTLATFLAGLCSQNYRTVNSMAVMTRDNQQWSPLLHSLFQWCTNTKADVYFVRWMEDTHVHGAQASSAYSISQVVPHDVLEYLASDNNQIVPAMTATIAGVETNTSENPIGRLVAPVITRVIEDDLKRSATNYGHLVIGTHLEMHLVDAMRRLVRGGKWIANNVASGGRLWVGKEGVYIDWSVAASDIANLLARDSFAGIPKDPDTLADLLVSANLLQLNESGSRYWTIALPGTFEAKEGMVKLREGEVIFPRGFDFEPYKNIQLALSPTSTVQANQQAAPAANGTTQASIAHASALNTPSGMDVPAGTANEKLWTAPKQELNAPPPAEILSRVQSNEPLPEGNKELPATATPKSSNRKKPRISAEEEKDGGTGKDVQAKSQRYPDQESDSGASLGADVSPTAAKLLGSLKRTNAWLLNEVMQAYRNGTMSGVTAALPYGFGISHEELNRHGIPVMELLEELGLKAWLWQDKTRASRRIHPVEINGKTHRMIILKPEIASSLGFDMTPPKE